MSETLLTHLPHLISEAQEAAAEALAAAQLHPEGPSAASAVIRADNLAALAQLAVAAERDESCRAALVYLDPPYDSGADYRNRIETAVDGATVALTQLAYRDRWRDGTDDYLRMLIPRLILAHRLLADDGALIVHLDWHASHVVRMVLDELCGRDNFVNHIVWAYRSGGASRTSSVPRKHDDLLLYRRGPEFRIRPQRERQLLDKPFMGSKIDAAGNHYVDTLLRDVLEGNYRLVDGDTLRAVSVRPVLNVSSERTGYATQKPEGLLEILLRWCTDDGDLVVDAFGGSGTTAVVAARLGRRFITVDASARAEVTTRSRLDAIGADYLVQRDTADAPGQMRVELTDDRSLLRNYEPAAGLESLLRAATAEPNIDGWAALAGWAVTDSIGRRQASWRQGGAAPARAIELTDMQGTLFIEAFDLAGRVTQTELTRS